MYQQQGCMVTSSGNVAIKFVVKVNGQVRTSPLPQTLAEAAIQNLPESERASAIIVPVTEGGQELLLES